MNKNIFQYLKIIIVGTVISVGISYVYAWTAPTATPPGGNVSAPINTSATAQTKAGELTVSGLTTTSALNMGTNNIVAGGANSTYGAMTIQGAKNNWSGLNFKDLNGNNSGTLMMRPGYSGFFNAADNGWRMFVTDAGNVYASDFCTTERCLGQAGNALGVGQTWQSPARSSGTTYTNTTGKPIMVTITFNANSGGIGLVDGNIASRMYVVNSPGFASFIVPAGSTYSFTAASGISYWQELR